MVLPTSVGIVLRQVLFFNELLHCFHFFVLLSGDTSQMEGWEVTGDFAKSHGIGVLRSAWLKLDGFYWCQVGWLFDWFLVGFQPVSAGFQVGFRLVLTAWCSTAWLRALAENRFHIQPPRPPGPHEREAEQF